jgi:hypothetical protein
MQTIGQVLKKEQANLSSLRSSQDISALSNTSSEVALIASKQNAIVKNEDGSATLSIYRGNLIDGPTCAQNVLRIQRAFPSLNAEFYDLLIERMKDKGFTNDRMISSVNHVIDNCQYPTPTLANFLSFDKRIKLLTYNQVCNLVTSQEAKFDNFTMVTINEKKFWVSNADKELYGLPIEL